MSLKKLDVCLEKSPTKNGIKVIFHTLNQKYKSKSPVQEEVKREVKKVLEQNASIRLFFDLEISKIIKKDKFIDLVCMLLPRQKILRGGDDDKQLTKYKKAKYFSYDRKYFMFDVLAISAFLISLILLYISYIHFMKMIGDVDIVIDYNKIVPKKELQIDSTSLSAFFKYAYHLIQSTLCSTGENIFTYIKNEIINLEMKTLEDINTKCYINTDNSYYNFILNGIKTFYNPTGSQNCALEVLNHNLFIELHNKIHNLKLSQIQINDIFIYSYRAVQLGVPAVSYLSVRLGLRALPQKEVKPASPKSQHSYDTRSSRKQKMIENTGGKTRRRRNTKNR
jgi:hypothetical protein